MPKATTTVATPEVTSTSLVEEAKVLMGEGKLDEAQKKLAEAKKLEKAEAKAKAAGETEEQKQLRNDAIDVLGAAILDCFSNLTASQVCIAVNPTKLIAFLDTEVEGEDGSKSPIGDSTAIKEAVEALEALGGFKGPKSSRNGTSSSKEFAASGELTAMQKRILAHLFETNEPANRQKLTEVANGKTKLASGRPVTMDGNQLGQRDPAQRHPMSLLGRGYIKEHTIDVDGKQETHFEITKDGKAAAKKLASA